MWLNCFQKKFSWLNCFQKKVCGLTTFRKRAVAELINSNLDILRTFSNVKKIGYCWKSFSEKDYCDKIPPGRWIVRRRRSISRGCQILENFPNSENASLRKLEFHFLSNWMGYDRGESFPFDFLNQIEFHLVQNWKKNRHHDHIPFNVKGNRILVFSVYLSWLKRSSDTIIA